jgi:2-polyprenyl-3-methyl-5-hydroxy-6-metoxy-1,4-benzoquinol methylase
LFRQNHDIDIGSHDFSSIELRACERCDLRFYAPPLVGDEKFYESLQRLDFYYLSEKQEYDFAARHISSEDRVLEVGAGSGAFAGKIRAGFYEGIELSGAAVDSARQRGLKMSKRSIADHAKDHAGCYDVVCAFQVLEHIEDTRSFLESSVGCLKPGGKLIQSVPREDGFVGQQHNNILNMPPHHATRWTERALRSVGALFELEIVEIGYDLLSDLHLRGYSTTLIENALNGFLGRAQRSLDSSFASWFVKAPIRIASLFLERGLRVAALRPAGHSITVVYRKP